MDGFDALGQVRDLCQPYFFNDLCNKSILITLSLKVVIHIPICTKEVIPSFPSQVKIIMATNRPDTLDPALLRPGRLDRKIGEKTLKVIKQILFGNCKEERKRKRDALVRLCPPFLFFSPAALRKVWSPGLRSNRFLSFTMQAKRSNKRTSVSKKIGRSGEGLSIRSQFRSLRGLFCKRLLCRRWSSSCED